MQPIGQPMHIDRVYQVVSKVDVLDEIHAQTGDFAQSIVAQIERVDVRPPRQTAQP